MSKSPHVERMEAELSELSDRSEKLTAFISGNPLFNGLPPTDQALMAQQLGAMRQYESVLSVRLSRAG